MSPSYSFELDRCTCISPKRSRGVLQRCTNWYSYLCPNIALLLTFSEFTAHQREVFCVFSGQGVIGLRQYLNGQSRRDRRLDDDDLDTLNGEIADDDDQTMTGMMGATALNGVDDDEADEELDDADESQNSNLGMHGHP